MSDELERFQQLKQDILEQQREADKAQGALDSVMKQLKQEFGCATLKEAKDLLQIISAKEKEAKLKFAKKLDRFLKKWKKVLHGRA